MKKRIPLHIVDGRLILTAIVECEKLRIRKQLMTFVIDTGSGQSYINDKDVIRLQIPVKGKESSGLVDFGGSRFTQITLPMFTFYLLEEGIEKETIQLEVLLLALKTTKKSERRMQMAEALPSILGLNFLKEKKLSLHVVMSEELAYLEFD